MQIEIVGITPTFFEVNPKYLRSRIEVGQIEEKQFVESPLAHQLGRQMANVIRRGDEKRRRLSLLHPIEDMPQKPARRRVGIIGKRLLDFVAPYNRRRHGIGNAQSVPQHGIGRIRGRKISPSYRAAKAEIPTHSLSTLQ